MTSNLPPELALEKFIGRTWTPKWVPADYGNPDSPLFLGDPAPPAQPITHYQSETMPANTIAELAEMLGTFDILNPRDFSIVENNGLRTILFTEEGAQKLETNTALVNATQQSHLIGQTGLRPFTAAVKPTASFMKQGDDALTFLNEVSRTVVPEAEWAQFGPNYSLTNVSGNDMLVIKEALAAHRVLAAYTPAGQIDTTEVNPIPSQHELHVNSNVLNHVLNIGKETSYRG